MSLNDGAGSATSFSRSRSSTAGGHVDVERDREVGRGGLRLGHAPRHGLLEPRELLDLDLALGAGLGLSPARPRPCRPSRLLLGLVVGLLVLPCPSVLLGPASLPRHPLPSRPALLGAGFAAVLGGGLHVGLHDPPAGPGALEPASSTPSSRAIRRATGEAFTRPPSPSPSARCWRASAGSGRWPARRRLGLAPARARRLGLLRGLLAACPLGLRPSCRRLLARLADPRDHLADRQRVALLGHDLDRATPSVSAS